MFVIGAGNLEANAHAVGHVTSFFVVACFALVLMFVLIKVLTTSDHRGAILSIPIALIVGVVVINPGIIKQFLDSSFGRDDSMTLHAVHPATNPTVHHVPHHATWLAKHWLGVLLAFVSFVALIAAVWLFVRAAKRWYNSPAKLEARERKHDDFLRHVEESLLDNPDLQTLISMRKRLERAGDEESAALIVRVDRLLEIMDREARIAAREPEELELERIEERNDPGHAKIPSDRPFGG